MKSRSLALLLLAVFFVNFSQAQQPWSLSDCIDYAHNNNLQIKRAQLQAEIADNNLFQSKMNILPDLNGSASRNYSFGRQVDQFTNDFINDNTLSDNYGLYSNINLFSGLTNLNSIKANKYNALSKMQDVEREKVEISFEIATAYLKILFNKELLEVARRQREMTKLQVDRTGKLVQAGSSARGDLLEISAQLAAEGLNVTNSNNELNLAYLNLSQILDLDSVNGFEIIIPDSVEIDFSSSIIDVNSVYNDGLVFLPHVKSAEYLLEANERNLAIQKGRLSPRLSFDASWVTGYSDSRTRSIEGSYLERPIGYLQSNPSELVYSQYSVQEKFPYMDQINANSSKRMYFTLAIPIFNRWQTNTYISNAKINVLDAETNLDLTKQALYKEIQQAHNDAVSAKEKFNSASEAVKSYREAFGYTEQKYTVGIVNSVEYNIAKNNFIKAESDLLQAKYEYIFALKILDFYRGIPLSL